MLLHVILKCYLLVCLFIICATAPSTLKSKHKKSSRTSKDVKSRNFPVKSALRDTSNELTDAAPKPESDSQDVPPPDETDDPKPDPESPDDPSVPNPDPHLPDAPNEAKPDPYSLDDANEWKPDDPSGPKPDPDEPDAPNDPNPDPNLPDDNNGPEKKPDDNVGTMTDLNKISIQSADVAQLGKIPGYTFSSSEMSRLKIWPKGVIPFYVDDLSYDKGLRDSIREHLENANALTGLQFLEIPKPPADDKARWVFFINRRGQLNCTDYNPDDFTVSGVQRVVMGYDCLSNGGEMAATILALAGVPPQHNAPDRDKYIKVSMNSIQPDKTKRFEAVEPQNWLFHDMKYDFQSAGHYHWHKYTNDGTATIQPVNKVDVPVGEVKGFSPSDILKLRIMYNNIAAANNKNMKLPECKLLYRPGPKQSQFKDVKQGKAPVRRKPAKYVEAAQNTCERILDGTENSLDSVDNKETENVFDGKSDISQNKKTRVIGQNKIKLSHSQTISLDNKGDENQSVKDIDVSNETARQDSSNSESSELNGVKAEQGDVKNNQDTLQHESLKFNVAKGMSIDPLHWSDITSDN